MKKSILFLVTFLFNISFATDYTFSVKGTKTFLNNSEIQIIGLRCSNSIMSDKTTDDLVNYLGLYKDYGVNTISVFFMGSRFGDVKGYNEDGSLNKEYAKRMAKIIKACDEKGMIVLIGCLYWGETKGKWKKWTQREANAAIANTVKWLKENNFRNTFIDPDNEGMANKEMGFDISEMITAGKDVDSSVVIGYNAPGIPPANADLAMHVSEKSGIKPYIESEGTMSDYWGAYSKEKNLYEYINVGVYTEGKKKEQIKLTDFHLKNGYGYIFASTWLQNIPPNHDFGGKGTHISPGILWWMEYIKENYDKPLYE